jgi:hypothetical protein
MTLNRQALSFIYTEPVCHIRRPLTVLLAQPWQELNPPAQTTLYKLIQALGIHPFRVPLVHRPTLTEHEVRVLNTEVILAFGINTDTPLYTVQHIAHTAVVYAEQLPLFSESKESKQKLWQTIKPLFALK